MLPARFEDIPAYPFVRLRELLDGVRPGSSPISMAVGEPTHPFPPWVIEEITKSSLEFNKYPPNEGTVGLRKAISTWILNRYGVEVDPLEEVVPLNGSREGLYNAAMALCPETKNGKQPIILMPDPFYQVYMFAALSVGAQPLYLPSKPETGFLPDFFSLEKNILNQTAIVYICSPTNPQGAVACQDYWKHLLTLAETYNFKVFSDECYSEIYRKRPPIGALEIAKKLGADPDRVVVFNSLSKRSNLPGLRSGFILSGKNSIKQLKILRSYSGAPIPSPLQNVAEKVWLDENHVQANRKLYNEKFDFANSIFEGIKDYTPPEAGFFLWLRCEEGEAAAAKLWREVGLRVLPGAYISNPSNKNNSGQEYIRVALVAQKEDTYEGLRRLRSCLYNK